MDTNPVLQFFLCLEVGREDLPKDVGDSIFSLIFISLKPPTLFPLYLPFKKSYPLLTSNSIPTIDNPRNNRPSNIPQRKHLHSKPNHPINPSLLPQTRMHNLIRSLNP